MIDAHEQHRLSQDEVHQRMGGLARIPEASAIALGLGQQLVEEVMNRVGQIDIKGISVLGWSGAILTFLLLHAPKMYQDRFAFVEILGASAMVLAFVAAFSGMWASRVRQWRGVSDETWFPDPQKIIDAEHLRQHYLAELHESRRAWDVICQRKAAWLRIGQSCLVSAAFMAVLILLYELVESVR